ncbi:MAG: serine/threonine-protein phosphatase [Lachnospiraceae bacterium]|nr:serine/threonine-protein phosphatase [Lachnospiraceae bacterium]
MKYLTSVYWERGSEAEQNQDSLVVLQVVTAKGRVLLAAVCDGMGGESHGEKASGYVTQRLQEWFYESLLRAVQRKKAYWIIRRSLDRLAYDMQEQLSRYAKKEEIRMGTTMTVLVLWERTYLLWHLGDSRVYRLGAFRKGKTDCDRAVCMTTDHVRGSNQLTKCVGSFRYERPDFVMGTIKEGQAFLMCSDGFRNRIDSQEIYDALNPGTVKEEEQASRRLREIGVTCMKRGEKDNMSAIYIKAVK